MKNMLFAAVLTFTAVAAFASDLSVKHQNFGLTAEPAQAVCLQCHGSYDALAQKTKASEPNPHANHMGKVQCNACHTWKGQSRLMCNDCHNFPALEKNLNK